MSTGNSCSSSCWSVYRPQPNTRWLAHSSSMSVYTVGQSMHVRTEPKEPMVWAQGKSKQCTGGATGAWCGESLWWKYQLLRHYEKRRRGPVSSVWSPWFHTLHQHWEQNSKVKVSRVHLEKPARQHLSIISGNRQNMTFLSNRLVCVFPWENWELLDQLHVLAALYLMQCLPQKGLLGHVIALGDSHPSHGAHVPPHVPRGGDGGPGLTEWGREKETELMRQHESETKKERHLLLISMGKFPRSWRLGWSPPDRAHWLLQGSPFVSRLPQALLA